MPYIFVYTIYIITQLTIVVPMQLLALLSYCRGLQNAVYRAGGWRLHSYINWVRNIIILFKRIGMFYINTCIYKAACLSLSESYNVSWPLPHRHAKSRNSSGADFLVKISAFIFWRPNSGMYKFLTIFWKFLLVLLGCFACLLPSFVWTSLLNSFALILHNLVNG